MVTAMALAKKIIAIQQIGLVHRWPLAGHAFAELRTIGKFLAHCCAERSHVTHFVDSDSDLVSKLPHRLPLLSDLPRQKARSPRVRR